MTAPKIVKKSELYGTPISIVDSNDPEFRRVYGAHYIPERRSWIFPAYYPFMENVADDLKQIDVETEWDPAAEWWLEAERQRAEQIKQWKVDEGFNFVTKPYTHQKEALAFAVHNLRAALLLDMGLGKTKVAIDLIRHEKLNNPVKALVIVPVVILYKWKDEVLFHSGDELKPVVIDGSPKRKKKLIDSPGDVYIATYGTVASPTMMEYIAEKLNYNIIIVDESHNLQTHNSAKTRAIMYLARKAYRRVIMSGTAVLGDPRHLWGQLSTLAPFLNPEENFWKFCGRFVHYQDEQRRVVLGYRNLHILNRRLQSISIRKKKEDALDLPPRTFVTIDYTLSDEQKDKYNELVTATLAELELKLRIIEEATPAARLIKLLQICSAFLIKSNKEPRICDGCIHMFKCEREAYKPYTADCSFYKVPPASTIIHFDDNPKKEALQGLLEMQLLEPTNKVIIWAKFLKELDAIETLLMEMNVLFVRVDGSLSGKQVRQNVETFQMDPYTRVYIGQIATGVGIDLTAANYVNFYSLTWDLGQYLQALDRAHRIGQTRNVTVYTLLGKGTVEGAVYKALEAKEDISAAITDPNYNGPKDFIRRITHPVVIE